MKNLRLRVRVAPFLILAISLVAPAAMGASDDHLHDSVPKAKATRPKLDPPARLPDVTARVYFDIEIKEKKSKPRKGRITFGLFGNVAPKAVENFMSLCECNKGNGKVSGKPLCYKGSEFHRIIPNFGIQGGDITKGDGTGGESIFGGNFEDESFEVLHNKLYLLSLANRGPNTNQSQFFINTVKTSWLDKKNVVFGMVLEGFDLVDDIEAVGTNAGDPLGLVTVTDSGVLDTMQAAMAATSEKRR